jgi:hypothetical protein
VKDYLVRIAGTRSGGTFILVCGKKSGNILADMETLIRLAHERGPDSEKFRNLVEIQHVLHAEEIIDALGPEHLQLLKRIFIESWPEEVLRHELDFYTGRLAGARRPDLVNHIFKRFSDAGEKRLTVDIGTLLVEIESIGISMYAPAEINLADEPQELARCLFLLQRCPAPLPASVL